jgi:hypothetical protein
VRKLGPFKAAIEGDDTELRNVAGPDAIIRVAPDLSSALVVRPTSEGKQAGTVAILHEGGGSTVARFGVPRSFRVTAIDRDGEEFVLTAEDGRTVHGTPDQFAADPLLIDEEHNPRYAEQREQIFYERHLLPPKRFTSPVEPPATDAALSEPDAVIEAGEAMVKLGEDELWLSFECAGPGKVAQLLPHARELLADIERIGRDGAEFMWSRTAEADETEEDRDEFFEVARPTSLVIYVSGDFAVHYEETTEIYVMDGYWLAVQFTADRTPVIHYVDA